MIGGLRVFPIKEVDLENKEKGKMTFKLREYKKGDEDSMVACIKDEYQDTYFRKNLYSPVQIWQESESGRTTFLVAEADDSEAGQEIAGMMMLARTCPEEAMCEFAAVIILKKYRGYGLAEQFYQYGIEILKGGAYAALYSLPVLFHDITQRVLYRQGFRATGLMLNVFDVGKITHSYENGANQKHSQGISVMAQEKTNAGTLYVPWEKKDFCKWIYDRLGVFYRIGDRNARSAEVNAATFLPGNCDIVCMQNEEQSSLEIRIGRVGSDLRTRMDAVHKRYPLVGRQTANVLLNINDRHAVRAYRLLQRLGYFFAGFKPLCGESEYMVMHNPGEVEIYFEDYALSDEFRQIAYLINQEINQRK